MIEDVSFSVPGDSGAELRVRAWRIDAGRPGPKVHLQAGVHADEIAGMLVLHELLARLRDAAERGVLHGSVTLVPQANPIGIGQFRQGRILGRHHDATSRNFNRGFPASAAAGGTLDNLSLWQKRLAELAAPADIVLDLHTDDEAVQYVYLHECFWPAGQDLAAALRAELAIIWDGDSDGAFEEVVIAPWLAEQDFAGRLVATVELRGQGDVSDALARQDADGIYRFLGARGVVSDAQPLPEWKGIATPIGFMETVFAPVAGVLVFERELGDWIGAGERIGRIIARPGDAASEHVLRAPQAGMFATRYRDRLIPRGAIAAKLTGSVPSSTWSAGALDP
ncbi:succinylglutamate desuccinylase/aspartoacylase family protein [Pseudomonas sp. ZM23]|uniref:Succinylglutamate desuccinylase/aspartoacylase family protein n=1 Tax=Pseudomonas triclosanedens TaxID=2961893 RepID=A0ABY7A376_9PSED|nr:succinylglutamate desuccinylase/aspartoacylase family protein [Pseudomonas triclosanedens]MCP8463813.1 succinylglutamate desuccinylase/aspartoacylase family protein [Pseudomonas triclosanedens]MCP8468897.1 succinylglutamate desuccinylase/aspartoacylase family protein [Pseudomonas triclosanedens]MCP8475619.1 succinylglutamate desuccinylase/aspartoacylase family protein [Pseudomonas triclosanedens]WAI50665.1 succinylglutamate desuccinylase/aspartoacylase family protein [Pseudomonas triclosaned